MELYVKDIEKIWSNGEASLVAGKKWYYAQSGCLRYDGTAGYQTLDERTSSSDHNRIFHTK